MVHQGSVHSDGTVDAEDVMEMCFGTVMSSMRSIEVQLRLSFFEAVNGC